MIINKHNVDKYIIGNILDCSNKSITSIEYIPNHIRSIYCECNKLTQLPDLPKSLVNLDCHNNKLTQLPKLPEGLIFLYCENNNLPSSYPKNERDKQWIIDHNKQVKLLNRSTTINTILKSV